MTNSDLPHHPSDAAKAVEMARAALEDDAKATKGPWDVHGSAMTVYNGRRQLLRFMNGDSADGMSISAPNVVAAQQSIDAHFIANARTREPLLATSLLALAEENERLKAAMKDAADYCASLPCPHAEATRDYKIGWESCSTRVAVILDRARNMMARGESAPGE